MLVDLRTLQPNPMRDFTVDPIDPEVVETLKRSIRHHGFWGGVVCRRLPDGTIQIGAGHHRVEAAIAEGIVEADVAVYDDRDDAWMVQVYAGENATQRGGKGLAEAGSVAAAVRWLAKMAMTDRCDEFVTPQSAAQLRKDIVSERGIRRRIIVEFLQHVPGVNESTLREHLANLKASGDYARIIGEVAEEVERQSEDVTVVKTVHQAAAQASEQYGARTFDFEAVTKHLRNSHQIEVFRKLVTGKGFKDALPVENQAPLAQHLVEVAKSRKNAEVSGAFIRENVMSLLLGAKETARKIDWETQQRLQEEDVRLKISEYGRDMARYFRLITATGLKMERLAKECPEAFTTLDELGELQKALRSAKRFIDLMNERICP